MSGTFALSAKFALSQYDMEIQSALLSSLKEDFDRHSRMARRSFKTLKEDLEVYEERALGNASIDEILQNLDGVNERSNELLSKWTPGSSTSLNKLWREEKKLKRSYRDLTSNYDDAAVVGYKFRLDSEEKIASNMKWSLVTLGISAVGSLLLSIWLSLLIISPLNRIQTTCQDVSEGNFTVRAHKENRDEFGMLATSFNLMLDNIEEKRENMSSLLTTIPFALFYFDKSGKISDERSRATDKIFPEFTQATDLKQFFAQYGENSPQISEVVDVMFAHALPFSSAAFLLPQSLKVPEAEGFRLIQLSYQPKRNAKKKLERVIILGEDITEKEKAQSRSRELMERVERISKISSDLNGYREFLVEVNKLISTSLQTISQSSPALMRDLHSLKGLLGIYSFTEIARKVHTLESELSATKDEASTAVHRMMDEISSVFRDQSEDVSKILALDIGKNYRFYDERKIESIRRIAEVSGNKNLMEEILKLERYPAHQVFAKYAHHVQELSQKFEDKKVMLDFVPGDELTYAEIRPLEQVLIHIFNNSVDHGIETSSERVEAGKDETGRIGLACKIANDKLQLTLTDDGRGIDGEKLMTKAINAGIIKQDASLSPDERLSLIFLPGLSIKDEASLLSGRGVGMDAVKTYIESQGGTIQVSSKLGAGTVFNIPLESHVHHSS